MIYSLAAAKNKKRQNNNCRTTLRDWTLSTDNKMRVYICKKRDGDKKKEK